MKKVIILSVLVVFFLFSLRMIIFHRFSPQWTDGQEIFLTTTLLSDQDTSQNYDSFKTRCCSFYTNREIFVIIPKYSHLHYGQRISIKGKVTTKKFKNGTTMALLYYPKVAVIKEQENVFTAFSYWLRKQIFSLSYTVLPANEASLLIGILLGIKTSFSEDFISNLRISGLTHVIAASGMNITLIASFLLSNLINFVSRKRAILITLFFICLYTFIAGFQPSIVRAAIMGSIAFSAQYLGRQYISEYILLLTALIMLMIDPLLVNNIGFQLSFLATAGILFIKPLFSVRYPLIDDLVTTIIAQLMTVPVILFYFGEYGLFSLLANALVLWTIPILMAFGGTGAILGLIMPWLGKIIFIICLPFLWYFRFITDMVGSFSSGIYIETVPVISVYGYYIVVASLVVFVRKQKTIYEKN